jgi:transcriptional regulator with XRE-family HTH domain
VRYKRLKEIENDEVVLDYATASKLAKVLGVITEALFSQSEPRRNCLAKYRQGKMTLQQLSDATGIGITYLSRIEHNKRPLKTETAEKIAQALGISVEDLYVSGDFKQSA